MMFLIFSFCIPALAVDTWTTKADMPTARCGLGVTAVNGKVYAIGGATNANFGGASNIVEEYDPSTNIWTTKANMPTARCGLGVATVNGKIYAIGGDNGNLLNAVEEYDPGTNIWTTKANMPTVRKLFGIAVVNGKIYAIGGFDASRIVEEYNPVTNTWATKADMPTGRYSLAVAVSDGKIYATGGPNSTQVEEYNPATNTWVSKPAMPTMTYAHSTTTINDKIYIIGGTTTSDDQATSKVEEYDPTTGTWTTKTNMLTARMYLGVAELNGAIYAIGGTSGVSNSTCLQTVEVYTVTSPPPTNLTATTGNGQVNLTWTAATNATGYNVKRAGTSGGSYTTIANNISTTTYTDTDVSNGNTYYYVVSAIDASGESPDSNEVAASLEPNAPNLTATSSNNQVTLSWSTIAGATSYKVFRAAASNGYDYNLPLQTVNAPTTTYSDTTTSSGATYYYVVRAVNSGGESENSNEVSTTIRGNKAILVITMTNGAEKEYDLTMSEIYVFINWYDNRANGTGKAYYCINKNYNVKPFFSRKDYIIFDKILDFEIKDYNE